MLMKNMKVELPVVLAKLAISSRLSISLGVLEMRNTRTKEPPDGLRVF